LFQIATAGGERRGGRGQATGDGRARGTGTEADATAPSRGAPGRGASQLKMTLHIINMTISMIENKCHENNGIVSM